ncbi:hypothetical protein CPLU01_13789 [Colletotrichum plurivorum]|uniref:Uncharacterized protein n=1 Tax=Colletotrichum plurivorum TaxID=2175906 RepID=A0A8H6JP36_9PEZI|nr:hypothetical protein CPLU01_13789 [Colletotrichum plurivorum]
MTRTLRAPQASATCCKTPRQPRSGCRSSRPWSCEPADMAWRCCSATKRLGACSRPPSRCGAHSSLPLIPRSRKLGTLWHPENAAGR